MEIKRYIDGKEYCFEITERESYLIHRERERLYRKEDVLSYIEGKDIEMTEEEIDKAIEYSEKYLENNDTYWEAYWDTINFTIEEVILEEEEEE